MELSAWTAYYATFSQYARPCRFGEGRWRVESCGVGEVRGMNEKNEGVLQSVGWIDLDLCGCVNAYLLARLESLIVSRIISVRPSSRLIPQLRILFDSKFINRLSRV